MIICEAIELAEVLHHFPGGHAVVDGGVGGKKADALADLAWLGGDVESVDLRKAAGRLQDRAENAHGGGLAGAVGPQQAKNLAGPGDKADVINRHNLAPTEITKRFGEVFDVDHGIPWADRTDC